MKPPPFAYVAPPTVIEAVSVLALHDGEARPLAGGQSLVPMLNFRLVAPSILVDIGRIAGLADMAITPTEIRVGAMTRTARLLDRAVDGAAPLVTAAARLVAHPQIRSRGTVGGSIANADPAAELPALALLTGSSIRLAGPSGERRVAAAEFFKGMFTTACGFDEIVTGIDIPRLALGTGWGFREFARRPGDFAVAGVGALLTLKDEAVATMTVVVFGVGGLPLRVTGAEKALLGKPASAAVLKDARGIFETELAPDDSAFGSAAYKRRVAGVLFAQVVAEAVTRAGGIVTGIGRA